MGGVGRVYLVGAGPGDPGLLTLRGLQCLQEADLVLYDGLVNPLLLRHTSATAVRTCRDEGPRGRWLNQAEITQQLITAAQAGQTVVRLKGGDPYIFGRGAEEAAELSAAGIPYEVVPGVTAATGAAIYAGVPLTHRECASAVAFVTGHEDPTKPGQSVDYAALARFPGTLVFYMGLHRLPEIARALREAGKPPDLPAVVISRGTWPQQRSVTGTLDDIAERVATAQLTAPSILVFGDCAAKQAGLNWVQQRPLLGLRIGITRPEGQTLELAEEIWRLGAEPVLLPTIEISPPESWTEVDQALQQLDQYQWVVFTSANGVRQLLGRLWETGGDVRRFGRARLAAIGTGTADALREFHLCADLVPAEFRAEALAAALAPRVQGQRILWARASRGRDVLPRELRAAGADLTELVVYRNTDVTAWPAGIADRLENGDLDWIGLSSPSIARQFAALATPSVKGQLGQKIKLCSISPVTTAAAHEVGLPISAEATTYTWAGICEAIGRQRERSL